MKFIEPSVTIVKGLSPLQKIALIARVCTGTQDKAEITREDTLAFCEKLRKMGHTSPFEHARVIVDLRESVFDFKEFRPYGIADRMGDVDTEHASMNIRDFLSTGATLETAAKCKEADGYLTACFDISIGISRELCRHRSMSFMERSTRWCSWKPEDGGIEFVAPENYHESPHMETNYNAAFMLAETFYYAMLKHGNPREMARSVLPLATATRLYVTGTFEHWAALLRLRLGKRAHPEMRRIMQQLCELPDFPVEIKNMVNHED